VFKAKSGVFSSATKTPSSQPPAAATDPDESFNCSNQRCFYLLGSREREWRDWRRKELVGDFKNGGREWQPKGQPEPVRVHDFVLPELGQVRPYGVYDLTRNEGWVNVGIDHDTAAFAAASIRGWWQSMGRAAYPDATELLITADAGGSNSPRSRLWKVELQSFADEAGLAIAVYHFPPGTSKWNKVEHRLFSHITQNWRGRPLASHEVIVRKDRQHHHRHRPQGRVSTRHQPLPDWYQDLGCPAERRATGKLGLPWRLELHDSPAQFIMRIRHKLFCRTAKRLYLCQMSTG
jgi:hypothetical protein